MDSQPAIIFASPLFLIPARRTFWRVCGVSVLAFALEVGGFAPVRAQTTPAGSRPLSQFDKSNGLQTDVLIGQNSKGPYLLTYKSFRPNTEIVVREGVSLHPDTDYTLDVTEGTILFNTSLRAEEVVRVSYRCDISSAVLNPKTLALPVQFDLYQSGQNRVFFRSLYRADPTQPGLADTPSTANALNYIGETRVLHSTDFTSGLFLDLNGGDMGDRSGLKLGQTTRLGRAQFGLGYSRAGADFAQEDVSGLKAGHEVLELNGSLALAPRLTFGSVLRQTNNLLAPGATGTGGSMREFGQNVAYLFAKNAGKIEAGRAQTLTDAPDGSRTAQVQDKIGLERALSKSTQATVDYQATTTQAFAADHAPMPGSYAQTTRLGVTTRPSDRVALTGIYQNDLGNAGVTDATGLKMELTPLERIRQFRITTNWEDKFQVDGVSRNREAKVELPVLPFGQTKLTGGVQLKSKPGLEQRVGLVDASTRPSRYVEVSGGVRLRDGMVNGSAPDPDSVNGYNVKLAVTPTRRLRLTGSMAHNPDGDDGTVQRKRAQTLGMETSIGILSLKGQVGVEDDYLNAQTANTTEWTLGLRLSRYDSLSTGYKGSTLFGSSLSVTDTYSLLFTRRFGSTLDFSLGGSMTLNRLNGQTQWGNSDLKAEAKVGIRF